MARLTHNDYLEQFSDSGIPGRNFLCRWIVSGADRSIWPRNLEVWKHAANRRVPFAIFAGLLGWFVQGFGEFSLYIPALAWTAFTLLGCLLGIDRNQFDKNRQR